MLRVALLADTHGQLDPRIAALVAGCDLAVHGGDIGNADVLARLLPRSGRVHAVLGNNDTPRQWPAFDRALLAGIPELVRLALPGGELVVVHGHRVAAADRHRRLRAQFPSARVIVYGHSHRLIADQDQDPWVLNPGAAGRVRTYGGPSCMVLGVTEARWALAIHRFAPLCTHAGRHPRPAAALPGADQGSGRQVVDGARNAIGRIGTPGGGTIFDRSSENAVFTPRTPGKTGGLG